MIAVDTNILVYSYDRAAPEHERALASMLRLVEAPAWGLPWIVVAEFYAVVTSPRRWRSPDVEGALAALDSWASAPGVRLLSEAPDAWRRLRLVLGTSRVVGRRVHDARIASVCLDAGVHELWSADRDFSRFPQLRVRNPLVGEDA